MLFFNDFFHVRPIFSTYVTICQYKTHHKEIEGTYTTSLISAVRVVEAVTSIPWVMACFAEFLTLRDAIFCEIT